MTIDRRLALSALLDQVNRRLPAPQKAELRGEILVINGTPVHPSDLQFTEEVSRGSGFRVSYTGRHRLRVGGLPKRNRFPVTGYSPPEPTMKSYAPLKNGGYNYSEIADRVIGWHHEWVAWLKFRQNHRDNAGLISRLRDELGRLPTGVVIEESGSAELPVVVRLSLDRNLTEDQARSFVAKLRRVL